MEDLISTQQAADELGITRSRIHQMIENGSLPATKFGEGRGGMWLIRRADLEKVRVRPGPGRPSKPKE
jgi:excisionase family DNA binding protein